MWADDFWGSYAWSHWERELRKVLPASEYPIIDVPMNHSIFHTLFDSKRFPQIPSIAWTNSGTTSERGSDSATANPRAVVDSKGRVMVFISHNTRFRGRVRARVGRSDVLLQFFSGRLCDRHQHPALHDDALSATSWTTETGNQQQHKPQRLMGQVIDSCSWCDDCNPHTDLQICKTSTLMASRIAFMLRAFSYPNYRLFFGGQIVSLIGSWISMTATSWLVYRLTGSAMALGVVGFAGQIPGFIMGPFAGAYLDRWDRHRVLVVTQTISMLQSFALAVLTFTRPHHGPRDRRA